jgi:hypothetical protein
VERLSTGKYPGGKEAKAPSCFTLWANMQSGQREKGVNRRRIDPLPAGLTGLTNRGAPTGLTNRGALSGLTNRGIEEP